MTGAVVFGLVLGALGLGAWFLARARSCAACGTAMEVLAPPDGLHTYEVLTCPSCPTAVTLSRGARNRFAFCPRCGRATLHTPCERLPDPPGQRLVRVTEACQLCGYSDERFVSGPRDGAPPDGSAPSSSKGVVLPFTRR